MITVYLLRNAVFWKFTQRELINHLVLYKCEFWLSFRAFSRSYTPPWKIIFYGNDRFSLESLKILNENRIGSDNNAKIVDILEVVSSMKDSPIQHYAVASRIPVHDWPYIVPANMYDIGVVVSFGHMIPSKSINACTFGMLNAHASLLPRWRGAAPLVHTILNGDKTTGITILQVSPYKFDRGKILLQECFDVPSHFTSSSLSSFLAPSAARLVFRCLHDLSELMKSSQPQTEVGATYACKVTPSMGHVDWASQTCNDIDRQYRAMNDILKLHTEWHGIQAKLIDMIKLESPMSAQLYKFSGSDILPGFCYYNKELESICIKCKDGWVGFKKIGLAGKKKLTAKDFHNGYLSKLSIAQCYFGKKTDI